MESVLISLGALLLRALPTFLIILLLHFYLKFVFFRPLDSVLAHRAKATAGVRQLAAQSLAGAQEKASAYEAALRSARAEMYREQEQNRNQWRQEQADAVASMRRKTDGMVRDARRSLAEEAEKAKTSLAAETDALAVEIAGAVLRGGSA